MKRYQFTLEYDGRYFCGWQKQPNLTSVQGALEHATLSLSSETVTFIAAGRTDAGVHATGQVAHATFHKSMTLDNLRRGLNFYLKELPVKVLHVREVPMQFHARFSAIQRSYTYIILNRPSPPVLEDGRVWWIATPLAVDAIREGAQFFQGHHDFSAFRAQECQSKRTEKTIDAFEVSMEGQHIYFNVAARSFLHNQIRIMIGTLKKIGDGTWPPQKIIELLATNRRSQAGPTAPPCGLYFKEAIYPAQAFID